SEGHHRRGLPLERIADVLSRNAARIFGLYPRKGAIRVGADADLTLVDLDRVETIDSAATGSHAGYSIYDGMTVRGWPVATIVRGAVVMREGEICAPAGAGRPIERRRAAPPALSAIA